MVTKQAVVMKGVQLSKLCGILPICYIIVIITMRNFLCCSAEDKIFITMVTRNPRSSDSERANFYCFVNSPDLHVTVSARRVISTRGDSFLINRNPEPPNPVQNTTAVYPSGALVYWIDLNFTNQDFEFGTYACDASWEDGQTNYTSSVSNIIMQSNARIYPSNGMVTKTVNEGDNGVAIHMILSGSVARNYVVWRHNDNPEMQPDPYNPGSYRFYRPVQKRNAGLYICYEPTQWDKAFHGMQRLIVRDCQSNRWGPPYCNGICDNCYNGGICDDETGRCICPPGFMGTNCLTACGPNRFGNNCEFTCAAGINVYNCERRQFCLPDPYGCSCNTGLKSLSCNIICSDGEFGANCLQNCNCQERCDSFTGLCSGMCEEGWSGQSCQIPATCPSDYYGSDCVEKCHCKDDAPCDKMTGECPNQECSPGYTVYPRRVSCEECLEGYVGDLCQEECHCEVSACDRVTGECSGQCKPQWITSTDCQAGLVSSAATTVNPNTAAQVNCTAEVKSYNLTSFRNLLSRKQDAQDSRKISLLWTAPSSFEGGIERRTTSFQVNVTTEEQLFCHLVDRFENSTYAFLPVTVYVFDLPELMNPPEKVCVSSSEVVIRWVAWDPIRDVGDAPVVAYILYFKRNSSDEWISGTTVESGETLEFRVADLETDTTYMFAVAAVREGLGGEGPKGPSLIVKTLFDVRDVTAAVYVLLTPSNKVNVSWQLPPPKVMCSTGVIQVYYKAEGNTDDSAKLAGTVDDVARRWLIFDEILLEPQTSYSFFLNITTDQGSYFSESYVIQGPSALSLDTSSVPVYLIILITILVLLLAVIVIFCIVRCRRKNNFNDKKTTREDHVKNVEQVNAGIADDSEGYISLKDQSNTVSSSKYEEPYHKTQDSVSIPLHYERTIVSEPQKPVATSRIQTKSVKGVNDDAYEDVVVSSEKRQLPDLPQSHPSGDEDEDNQYEVPDRLEEYTGIYVNIKNENKLLQPEPINVTEFENFMSRNKENVVSDIVHQFMALPSAEQYPWSVALNFQNKQKNFFKTILPYDHSRVKLDTNGSDARSDYINASYIKNYQGKTSFLAAQGPQEGTVDDFWKMVWQQNVEIIVMVTDTREENRPLCCTYWPSKVHMSEVFDDITVLLMESMSYTTHTIRKLNLLKGNHTPEVHLVTQVQVHSWPYGGVPKDITSLISIISKVKNWQIDGSSSPLLVHCSNGVGATGTFIAVYVLMDVIKKNKNISIFDFVKRIRDDRVDMVQTRIQYLFIFEFLLAVLQSTDSEMSSDELKKLSHTELKLKSKKEFKVLQESTIEEQHCEGYVGNSSENQHKNRFNNLIPDDKFRPVLKSRGNTLGSNDYINAFHLMDFGGREFILTQAPLSSTVEDFWRLVYDYECATVVMLNADCSSDETVIQYWPSGDGGGAQYGLMRVECTSTVKSDSCIESQFQLSHKKVEKISVTVNHFAFCGWSGNQPDVSKLMQFIRYTENKGFGPVLVHCINGVGLSAAYVIVKTESERVEQEGFVDVFQSLKKLRKKCPLAIQTQEEYTLCYQLLKDHLDNPDEYVVVY